MWKFKVSKILFIIIGELIFLTRCQKDSLNLHSSLTLLECVEMDEFLVYGFKFFLSGSFSLNLQGFFFFLSFFLLLFFKLFFY